MTEKYYAIGDIHGMYREMIELLDQIPEDAHVIFLGDYVDRGPDSRKVLDYVLSRPNSTILIGNHDMMGYEYGKYGWWPEWAEMWGESTIASYDGDVTKMTEVLTLLVNRCGEAYHIVDDNLFSHSGGNPTKTVYDQTVNDWFWFRYPVATANYQIEHYYSVHGHTPYPEPLILADRAGLDQGCVFGAKDGMGGMTLGVFERGVRGPVETITRTWLGDIETQDWRGMF